MKERRQGIRTIRTHEHKERTTVKNKERKGKEKNNEKEIMRGTRKGIKK